MTTPAEHYESLARALTLDQAFARAYSDVRRLCVSFCDNIADEVVATVLQSALEAVSQRLENDLADLMYDRPLAQLLARPE
jgi:hypothetical protein